VYGDKQDQKSSHIPSEDEVWKDLQVLFPNPDKRGNGGVASRVFLAAMEVVPSPKPMVDQQ
jgi:ABC-type sulfate transport system substrate-binding protein